MVSFAEVQSLRYFISLHLHSGGNSWSGSGIHLVHTKLIAVFLGYICGGMGVGQGFAPGDILDGQVFQDILLRGELHGLFLRAVEQILEIVRMHVPEIFYRKGIQGIRWSPGTNGIYSERTLRGGG